jgi:hypothetical protein
MRDALARACLTVAAEPLLGLALHAAVAWLLGRVRERSGPARRRWLAWVVSTRDLARIAPAAVAALGLGYVVQRQTSSALLVWPSSTAFLLAGALSGPGAWLLLRAGRREARGEWRLARIEARLGGLLVFAGVLARLVVVWADLLFDVAFRRAVLGESRTASALVLGMLGLGVAAFIAAVAGLAGKPRPAASITAAIYLASVGALAVAAGAARGFHVC